MKAILVYVVILLVALVSVAAFLKSPSGAVQKTKSTLQMQVETRKALLNSL